MFTSSRSSSRRLDGFLSIPILSSLMLLGLCAVVPGAHAQVLSLATGTLANNGTNIQTGNVFDAVNFYDPNDATSNANANPTINGVAFTGRTFNSTADPKYTLSLTNGNTGIDDNRAGGVATTDAIYPLVYSGVYNFNAGSTPVTTLTFKGLTVGSQYSAQLFFDSSDTRSLTVSDSGATSPLLTTGPSNGAGFITDSFTATAATETITFNYSNNALPDEFSGFDVTVVPEPSTYVMSLALCGVAVVAKRRDLLSMAKRKFLRGNS